MILLDNLRYDILHLLGTSGFTRRTTGPIGELHHLSLHPHVSFKTHFGIVPFLGKYKICTLDRVCCLSGHSTSCRLPYYIELGWYSEPSAPALLQAGCPQCQWRCHRSFACFCSIHMFNIDPTRSLIINLDEVSWYTSYKGFKQQVPF